MSSVENSPKGKRPVEEPALPDVWFGESEGGDYDWRKDASADDEPDDDEELPETPQDVIDLLGYDPLEE